MEFGLFCGGFVPKGLWDLDPATAEHERIMSEVRLVQLADRTNWKYWWTTEHHFLDEYSHISANEVLLPYVAALTEQIHLGSGIFNITPPVNHPARVAERVAMLDHLSEGRFEFGTGRGSSTTEQAGFGIDDPDLTKDMYDEVIGEFVQDVVVDRRTRTRVASSRCRPATCCPSRGSLRTRRCGWPPATRRPSRRPGAWASASCASRPATRCRWRR